MSSDRKPSLRGRVVVITGASSGIGRESARRFARRGASLVLAARRAPDLDETARLCSPAPVLVAVTDVTNEEDVQRLVEQTLARFGRIDIWVNNAGVTLFALLDEATFADHRRVIETNLYGPMYAARAVIPVFRQQRHGTMINVGSVLSKVGQPYVASYVISKFGTERLLSRALARFHFAEQREPPTEGNLYRPVERHAAHVYGERAPRVSIAHFAAWTLAELVRMELESVPTRVRQALAAVAP